MNECYIFNSKSCPSILYNKGCLWLKLAGWTKFDQLERLRDILLRGFGEDEVEWAVSGRSGYDASLAGGKRGTGGW